LYLRLGEAYLVSHLDFPYSLGNLGSLNGRRAITGDTALRLAHFLGTTAEFCSTCKVSMRYVSRWEIHQGVADLKASRTSTCIELRRILGLAEQCCLTEKLFDCRTAGKTGPITTACRRRCARGCFEPGSWHLPAYHLFENMITCWLRFANFATNTISSSGSV
jgi:hypothetical protein